MAFVSPLPVRLPTAHSLTCPARRGPPRLRAARRLRVPLLTTLAAGSGAESGAGGSHDGESHDFQQRINASIDAPIVPTEPELTRDYSARHHPTAAAAPIKPHHLRVLLLRIRALQTINTATATLTSLLHTSPTDSQLATHLGLSLTQLRANRLSGIRARNDIVASHIHLVVKIASRVHARLSRQTPRSIPVEDLVQEGCIALITAAERFDAARGVKFLTYAWNVVYRACLREAPRGSIVSVPERLLQARRRVAASVASGNDQGFDETVPKHLLKAAEPHIRGALPLDAPVATGEKSYGELMRGGVSPEEVLERELVQREVRTACHRSLPERYAEVLIMRFGLNGSPPKSGKAIAAILGVSEPRVAQIVLAGLEKLRKLEPELAEFVYDI